MGCSLRYIPVNHSPADVGRDEAEREAARRFLAVASAVYEHVVQAKDPRLAMIEIGWGLGLPAAIQRSQTEWASLNGITRQAFSKATVKFLQRANLPPSSPMRSEAARATARACH